MGHQTCCAAERNTSSLCGVFGLRSASFHADYAPLVHSPLAVFVKTVTEPSIPFAYA